MEFLFDADKRNRRRVRLENLILLLLRCLAVLLIGIYYIAQILLAGAVIFGHFLAVTRIPFNLASWIGGFDLPPFLIMAAVVGVYLIGGCIMDAMALIMLTIPIFYPVVIEQLGYDPIWFGVIIVLITHGNACLLGRNSRWPERRFSTLAGYVEPGESLEDAVRREVYEETNIRVSAVHYHSSQPWPFPSARKDIPARTAPNWNKR